MKKLYFLFFLVVGLLANAQIINIPDANFKAKLLSASSSNQIASIQTPDSYGNVITYNLIDVNGDGEIQVSEAQLIKCLKVSNSNISNLTGIEAFINLIKLDFNQNQLTNLNLTNNNLKFLDCSNNIITTINITNLSNLESLVCEYNQLTNIDVSQNYNLNYLKLNNNGLSSIDVSQNLVLRYLNIAYNQFISTLDVSQNTSLMFLLASNNQITSVDVGQNNVLESIFIWNNQLTNIDVSQIPSLYTLDIANNLISNININQNILLNQLFCGSNQFLTTLSIKNGNLNSWSYLEFSNNPNLEFVCCDDGDLALVQQKIIDYGYTTCQVSNLSCDYPFLYEVSGNVQYDYFDNGCYGDFDDFIVPNVKFEIFDGISTVITTGNQLGDYYIPLETGNYTITPVLENPNYFNVSPTNFTVNFPTDTSPFQQNICLTWNPVAYYDDLEVTILPITPARPGFEAAYKILVRNKGYDETNGTVTLSYDNSILTYVSSAPVFNSSNTNTISWDFYSSPFLTLEFDVVFDLNSPSDSPAVNIDDELHFTANVIHDWTDYTPADNTFTLDQTVVGSYDPNDKTCLQGETEEVSIVGEYVHYMIRFENTGTFLAEKVVIEDFIDVAKFDFATLIPLHASHSYYTKITGNKVEFIFDNINLDFNDPNNDGYIAFKIKLLPTLTIGDTFSNSSNIYFDANPAIVTNTYTTTIVAALSNQSFNENEFIIYPNPAKEVLNIHSKNILEIQSVEIYNLLGQIVLSVPNNTNAINVSSLKTGTYFIKINTDKGSINTKFIKE